MLLRHYLLIVVLFIVLTEGKSQQPFREVKFVVNYESPMSGHTLWQEIHFYGKDTTISNSYFLSNGIDKFKIDSIPAGDYTLVTKSIFGEEIRKSISLTKRSKKVRLSLPDHYSVPLFEGTPMIKNLSLGDTLTIFWNEIGCFNFDKGLVQLIYQNGCYLIKVFNAWTSQKLRYSFILSPQEVEQLLVFEAETIKSNGSSRCTSRYCYTFKTFTSFRRYKVGDCQNSGLGRLISGIVKEREL